MPQIEGVYAAAVTARRTGMQDINLGVMWDLIDFLCAHKVDGISLLGPIGEFIHFSDAERMRIMGLAPRRSRVPVLMDVSHSNLDGAVELAQAAAASGAAGVVLMPPYFFRYSEGEIANWFLKFAEDADRSIPVFAANAPRYSDRLSIANTRLLFESGAIQGIYETTGDVQYLSELAELQREHPFTLLLADESLCPPPAPGTATAILSGLACAVPELLVALQKALASGMADLAERLHQRVKEFLERNDKLAAPVLLKEATAMRGFRLGPHAIPPSERDQQTVQEFREWFQGWLPAVLQESKDA